MEKVVKAADKKATAAKIGTVQKKPFIKKKINEGQSLACEVCGMSVVIEEIGDLVVEEDSVLLCCGKAMKDKATVKKAVKK